MSEKKTLSEEVSKGITEAKGIDEAKKRIDSPEGLGYVTIEAKGDAINVEFVFQEAYREGDVSKSFEKDTKKALGEMEKAFIKLNKENIS